MLRKMLNYIFIVQHFIKREYEKSNQQHDVCIKKDL